MYQRLLSCWCCLLMAGAGFAQSLSITDSLEAAALRQSDTGLVKTYSELVWQLRTANPRKAIDYGRKAAELATHLKFNKGLAQVYNDVGIVYYFKQSFDSALLFYNKALELRKALNDPSGTAKLYNKIGIVHQQAGRFDKALDVQFQALKLFESLKDDIGISYSLNNIGILNQNMERFEEAIQYQVQSIAIKEKIHDRYGLAGSYVNVGNVYMLQKDYGKAKDFYLKGVAITRQINDKEYLSGALNSLGKLLIETQAYAEALPYVSESFELRQAKNDKKGMVKSLVNTADIYKELNRLPEAEETLQKAYRLAQNEQSCKPEMQAIYKSASEVYEKMGHSAKALENYKLSVKFKDTLFNESVSNRFAELQTKYETEKKNHQIALLGKDNSIKGLQLQNQKLMLDEQAFRLTQSLLALSEDSLHIANSELVLRGQNQQILSQKLDASERQKNIQNLQRQAQIQDLEIRNRQLALNRRNVLLSAVSGLFVLTGLLGYALYRRKQWHQKASLQAALFAQQQAAAKAVMEAEEAERQRIARDLHDGVGQMMSAAKMNLSAFSHNLRFTSLEEEQQFQKIIQFIDESCTEVRAVSHNMMPNALLKKSLAAAVREFISKLDERQLTAHLYTEGLDDRLDSNTEVVLYRVIQECVNNVIRHAGATALDINMAKEGGQVTVTVEDNGKGFDATAGSWSEGMGLKNIRTRVQYLNGSMDIDSAIGKGTLVAIYVPV